jgi:trehalose 6-phosphate phosphatase
MKNPVYIFTKRKNTWDSLARKLHSASGIDVFLDYDGTLTPIRRTPAAAMLTRETKNILQQLTRLPGLQVAIITGRSMADIRKHVRVENIGFAANHGFQIYKNGKQWIHPQAAPYIKILSQLHAVLRKTLAGYPKVILENKIFTLSIHYRNVAPEVVRPLKSLAIKTVAAFDPNLQITRGKKVLEVRPHIDWGKGKAVLKMFRTRMVFRRREALYIGDDTTDEDVFRELAARGITIRVGKNTSTLAQYFVRDVEEVKHLLQSIISLRTTRSLRRALEK